MGHVYSFGQGLSGQLGIKTPHDCNLPQVVAGPWLSPGGESRLDYVQEGEEDSPPRMYVCKISASIQSVISKLPANLLTTDSLRCYVILPLYKDFMDAKCITTFQLPFAQAVLKLSKEMSEHYRSWLATLPRDSMQRLVSIYKNVVVQMLKNTAHNSNSEIDRSMLVSSLRILTLVHSVNFKGGRKGARLDYEEFYIPEIAERIDIRNDYLNWLNNKMRPCVAKDSPISFCEYPFLFDAQAKTLLLRSDATRQMQGAIREAVLNSNPMLWLFDPSQVQFLNVHIRRTHIVEDTISQLLHHEVTDYKRPLKVHFIGEEAEDAGGVRKEFFLLLLRDILNPNYGMFDEYSQTNTIWFKEGALETASTFELIGGDEEIVYALNFAVTQDFYGQTKSIPLKAGGEEIAVTAVNKQEYVDLLVDYMLNTSIENQYRAFHDGFYRVCGGIVLKLFQPVELMDLVSGNENYSWTEFEKNTEYKGEYHPGHPVIATFWEVFHELSLDQKKQFLKFLTGTDRVPILGMKVR
ncbi:putative E3 ubiquitin-protein ligase HERC3 [Chionoecetes opilio]|uniref:HECT-type E3 ubiquitin transferase n=1 Tax=Chionoecetes opilio TaxID=41210 RepID=A0A8J4YNG2_CHIOP|nr:putative E3 ubiquitin-protein ligase HERC3 [Chionoecetes opilio]